MGLPRNSRAQCVFCSKNAKLVVYGKAVCQKCATRIRKALEKSASRGA
jgi:hypothetical protein